MPRPAVSVILSAAGDWATTKSSLQLLRATLGPRDEVLVVTGDEATVRGLGALRRVRPVERDALAEAHHEVVVTLPVDAVVAPRWLDALVAPLDDPDVVAVGPRTNGGVAAQAAPGAPCAGDHISDVRRFARDQRESHRDRTTVAAALDGSCLAAARAVLREVGGLGEELGQRLAGRRLLVADEVYVHRTTQPLLTASLIVKNEEDNLPACLASLRGWVDEIVIYDTGSTDGTVALARDAGATVIEGYWDDDFGRARNASMDHARGRWVLGIDADEVVRGDPAELRALLRARGDLDGLIISVDNLVADGAEETIAMRAIRVWRPDLVHFRGRLHEQLYARAGERKLRVGQYDGMRVRHSGYRPEVMSARGKSDRNVRLAEAAVAADQHSAEALMNLGRSLMSAVRYEEALARFAEAREADPNPTVLRRSLTGGADALLELGRPNEALEWIAVLREHSTIQSLADYQEGKARLALGQHERALECLRDLTDIRDDDGWELPAARLQLRRGLALAAERRWNRAAETLLSAVLQGGATGGIWTPLIEAQWRAGEDFAPLAAAVNDETLLAVLGQAMHAPAEAGDAFAEALWQRRDGDVTVATFGAWRGATLPAERALAWSGRARAVRLDSTCPLVKRAGDQTVEPAERVRCAAAALAAFGDESARPALAEAAAELPTDQLRATLLELDELAPALLPDLLLGAATTPTRCLAVARELNALGAREQAEAVYRHGFGRDDLDAALAGAH